MFCNGCSGTGKMPFNNHLNCPICNGKGYLNVEDIKEGMKVSTHIAGICCDVVEYDKELYLSNISTGEEIGKVNDNFEFIEDIM